MYIYLQSAIRNELAIEFDLNQACLFFKGFLDFQDNLLLYFVHLLKITINMETFFFLYIGSE